MKTLSAAVFGVIFGLGLLISGMLDPAKVLGFLDVTGAWNPQLAFVMGGAILVAFPAFVIARRRDGGGPAGDLARRPVDRRLLAGAALFGVGWGLSGICPGPGVVLLGFAGPSAWVFVASVIAGGLGSRFLLPGKAATGEA